MSFRRPKNYSIGSPKPCPFPVAKSQFVSHHHCTKTYPSTRQSTIHDLTPSPTQQPPNDPSQTHQKLRFVPTKRPIPNLLAFVPVDRPSSKSTSQDFRSAVPPILHPKLMLAVAPHRFPCVPRLFWIARTEGGGISSVRNPVIRS